MGAAQYLRRPCVVGGDVWWVVRYGSVAPPGLVQGGPSPTACAVGYALSPLRGLSKAALPPPLAQWATLCRPSGACACLAPRLEMLPGRADTRVRPYPRGNWFWDGLKHEDAKV